MTRFIPNKLMAGPQKYTFWAEKGYLFLRDGKCVISLCQLYINIILSSLLCVPFLTQYILRTHISFKTLLGTPTYIGSFKNI